MNCAIAIKSCHKHSARRAAVTDTWRKQIDFADAFFVIGAPTKPDIFGALMCDVSDEFANIAPKIGCACAYALSRNSDLLFVCDDDTYVRPDRLARAAEELVWGTSLDYVGFMRTSGLGYNNGVPYAQGSAYWLSARAMEMIVDSPAIRPGVIDDGAVGQALIGRVPFTHDWRYRVGPEYDEAFGYRDWITTHKCLPDAMYRVHNLVNNARS
jgi:hypothetical protein